MQHKWLQGLGTKKSMIQSNWRKGYVEQMWLQMCFESRKCPGQAQIYWKIVPSTWTGDGKSMVANGWAQLSRHQNFSHGEQPCANPKFETKVTRDSNTDFWINPDPDFRWICPKMLWMHYRVGVSHFAKYGTKHPFIVWEMLTNLQKSHIPKWWRKWKSDLEPTRGTRGSASPQKLITSRGSPPAHVC